MLLGTTVAATVYVGENRQRAARELFERRVQVATSALEQRVNTYTEVLYGLQGLVRASQLVTREEWREYVDLSDVTLRNRGIETLELIRHVPRSRGRREYFIPAYVEPLAEDETRSRFKLDGDTIDPAAIERARRTGEPTATSPGAGPRAEGRGGFRMFIPVYRSGIALGSAEQRQRAFIGLAGLTISTKRMLEDIALPSGIELQIYASPDFRGGASAPPNDELLLFSSDPESPEPRDLEDGQQRSTVIDVARRRWIAVYTTRDALGDWFAQPAAQAVFAGGALVSFLMFAVTLLLATARDRALSLASRMTSDLRQSEQRLKVVLDTMTDGLVAADVDGNFLIFNRAAAGIFGKGPANVGTPGWQSHYGLFLPDGVTPAPEEALPLVRAIRGETVNGTELVIRNERVPEGRLVEISASPLREDRRLAGGVATFRDVTPRKRTEAELARREEAERDAREAVARKAQMIDAALDCVITIDRNGRVHEWNPAAEKTFGYSREEAMGQELAELIVPPSVRESHRAGLARYRERGEAPILGERLELTGVRSDGTEFPVELTVTRLGTIGDETFVGFVRDITERKRTEVELARREEAERANRAKSEFLSRMSHELRTPLNSIIGFGQLLEMNGLDESERDYVGRILQSGQHLLELINEVLDISSIEAGSLSISIEPVDAQAVVADALELIRPMADQRGLRIEQPPSSPGSHFVAADQQRLRQILLNLLSNAVKYNRDGGAIRVSLEPRDERLHILVADTGRGLTAEQLERLFVPFERLGAEATGAEGTGLGLALSKRLAEAMHGSLEVESEPGTGTTFSLGLLLDEDPRAKTDLPTESERSGSEASHGKEQSLVLYIEDNLSNLRLVERILSHRPGLSLRAAMQGRLGLELAQQHHPELIVLDLHLPDISGQEVLEQLRANPATESIPVVVLSADATKTQIARLLATGAQEYLTKPLDVRHFLEVVDRYAGSAMAGAGRENERS